MKTRQGEWQEETLVTSDRVGTVTVGKQTRVNFKDSDDRRHG